MKVGPRVASRRISKELANIVSREPPEITPLSRPARGLPAWHLSSLVVLMLAVATTGLALEARGVAVRAPVGRSLIWHAYVPLLLVEWGLFAYVACFGRNKSALSALLATRWRDAQRGVDVGLAAVAVVSICALETLWRRYAGAGQSAAVTAVMPHVLAEKLAWCAVAVSAGFCEEVVYRGYLRAEFEKWLGSPALAVLLQAALFGLAHAEQGLGAAARLCVYGAGLGWLALARRSLVPGIIAHVAIDLLPLLLLL